MHSRPTPFGSHTDEYILDYLSFQAATPADEDLTLPQMCKEQPTEAQLSFRIGNFLEAARRLRPSTAPSDFEAFLGQHGKAYASKEHTARKAVFTKNMRLVDQLNKKHTGQTTFKANHLMDMSKEEIMSFRGGKAKTIRSQRRSEEHKKYINVYQPA